MTDTPSTPAPDPRHDRPGTPPEDHRWHLRALLEQAGLRVLDIQPYANRDDRWRVQVLGDASTEQQIRRLGTVDVVRYHRTAGDPCRYVLTLASTRA